MVNPSARQLFESIEAEHSALEATIQQQNEEIRSLKQQLSALEAAALARAEEQAANDRRVEQVAQQTAAMAQQLSDQSDEINRLKRYNAGFIAQFNINDEWVKTQYAALSEIERLLPSCTTAMTIMNGVRADLGMKPCEIPRHEETAVPDVVPGDVGQDEEPVLPEEVSEQLNNLSYAVFVPMDDAEMSTSEAPQGVAQGQLPEAVPEEVSEEMAETVPEGTSEMVPETIQVARPETRSENSDETRSETQSEILQDIQPDTLPEATAETQPGTQPEIIHDSVEVSLIVADNSPPDTIAESATDSNVNTPKSLPPSAAGGQRASPPAEDQFFTPPSHPTVPFAGVFPPQTPNRSTEKPPSAKRRMMQRPSATGSDSEDDLTKGSDTYVGKPRRSGKRGGRKAKKQKAHK